MEIAISTNWYFLAFSLSSLQIVQAWSVNYESYFGHFEICGQFLDITGYFALSNIEKLISTGSHFFSYLFLFYYKAYFRHVQKIRYYLCLRPFNMFSFRESSILIIKYVFRFFLLVAKLYKTVLQIIHLSSKHLRFLSSVDIGDFL